MTQIPSIDVEVKLHRPASVSVRQPDAFDHAHPENESTFFAVALEIIELRNRLSAQMDDLAHRNKLKHN